jgi:hypothetical protein
MYVYTLVFMYINTSSRMGIFFYASFIICDEHRMFDYNVKKHAAVSLV